jgi:hypothetical protein
MRERLLKISSEIPSMEKVKNEEIEQKESNDSIDDFLQSIEESAPAKSNFLSPSSLKRI